MTTQTLLDVINQDRTMARKEQDSFKATLLTTLYSEAARVGKDDGNRVSTDEEVTKTIRKFLKGITETLAVLPKEDARTVELEMEKKILESYLPAQVTGDALKSLVVSIVATLAEKSPKQMGAVMAKLKETGAVYDGKEASALVKEALI